MVCDMKIIIRIEQQIPNTTDYCVEERQIDPNDLYQSNFDLAGKVIRQMHHNIDIAIGEEMEKRGIRI